MADHIKYVYYKSPVGELKIGVFDNEICCCDWRYRAKREVIDYRIAKYLNTEFVKESSDIANECIQQLEAYFAGTRKVFDLPLRLAGSPFQIKVWEHLMEVPYGKTETYQGLSKRLNNLKAIRAVASANGANALSILIPCHRVIGSQGELTGYAGGIQAKRKLLQLEGSIGDQMSLF